MIDTADDEVKTAVGDAGIRVSNPETGDVVTLHLGSNPLKPGHYEIKNSSLPSGVNILPKKFHVEAGKTETLLATPADKNDNP